jgi:ribosomal protein S18 acetylase RimI-like enzyme
MNVVIRAMRDDDADAVAAMVRGLAEHIGTGLVPALTAEKLVAARDLIDVTVAEHALAEDTLAEDTLAEDTLAEEWGTLIGACLGLMTFSTWRGEKGLYVVDLFVAPNARGKNIGERLLRASAERAARRGARFIKLEVDETNTGAERFYARLGFTKKTEDRLHILEQDRMTEFIATGGRT